MVDFSVSTLVPIWLSSLLSCLCLWCSIVFVMFLLFCTLDDLVFLCSDMSILYAVADITALSLWQLVCGDCSTAVYFFICFEFLFEKWQKKCLSSCLKLETKETFYLLGLLLVIITSLRLIFYWFFSLPNSFLKFPFKICVFFFS